MVRIGTSESKFVFDSLEPVTIISSTSPTCSSSASLEESCANAVTANKTNNKNSLFFIIFFSLFKIVIATVAMPYLANSVTKMLQSQ